MLYPIIVMHYIKYRRFSTTDIEGPADRQGRGRLDA
jgi:hypothetical protein